MVMNKRSKQQKSSLVSRSEVGRIVQRAVIKQAEPKCIGYQFLATSVTAGYISSLNGTAQGDTSGTRTGCEISPKELNVRATMTASVNSIESLRMIIFADTAFAGTAPTTLDVLNTAAPKSTYNFINVMLQKRYTILHDSVYDFSTGGNFGMTTNPHFTIKNIPKLYYTGSGATDASLGRNALFILLIGTSTHVTYDLETQLVYTDI